MRDHLETLRDEHVDDVAALMREVVRDRSPDGSSLVEMCDYHLDTGGKRLRATIPLAVAEAVGTPPRKLLPFAAACELLHNATLVHDDLQDGDDTRRDQPTVWKQFGRPEAINLGDAMLYWALGCLDRLEVPDDRYRRCTRRFVDQTLGVIDGQQREFELMASDAPEKSDYLRMVEGKTGGLFVLTAAGAAELSGAPAEVVDALESAARDLGVLFQIQDDVLDLYGDKGRGERGADLREGKISALVVHYLERASSNEADALLTLLRRDRSELGADTIDRVAERFRNSGALEAALDELEGRRDRAARSVPGGEYDRLRDLVVGMADLFVAPIRHLL